ncbi:agmatine deiminase family protein [Flocculibacter collagenilyticus]|uniref:agmatine deiminase family protein n=1 Tax=Flocculibacter collagenilyticus TaxID=2744479 RepID=UPI0018F3CDD5|nr:agmatine deiminase family protein [Flocculibacter collagenilyticus]
MQYQLLPEWAAQDAVMLTWPHKDTDWAPILTSVEPVYLNIAKHILEHENLVIVAHSEKEKERISALLNPSLSSEQLDKVYWVITNTNDTWARDHGPITVSDGSKIKVLNFTFNGWGEKYEHQLDNEINNHLFASHFFNDTNIEHIPMVLEGGGIEINEHGVLLTTSECLLNNNRNPDLSKENIEDTLREKLGVKHFLWLDNGYLAGDDTDSHIDTLARFAPNNTIVYIACPDKDDEHYAALKKMETQLASFRTEAGSAYRLFPLPWPSKKINNDGERLPATYANYLIINNCVLVPTYQDDNDQIALDVIAKAYPNHNVIGIDCLPLVHQFGSLHCITMQLPKGTLSL